jgi:uncharacterized OsmC-like protein
MLRRRVDAELIGWAISKAYNDPPTAVHEGWPRCCSEMSRVLELLVRRREEARMVAGDVRQYAARARSTEIFGRVLCTCREHHFVVDGPVWNGCPGEAVTPGELFLAAVASCGVELLQVIAREREVGLGRVAVGVEGTIDRRRPVRADLALFSSVRIRMKLEGIGEQEAGQLVEVFKGR